MDDVIIKCDNNDFGVNNYIKCCKKEFILDKNNLFVINGVDYFGDVVDQYYTICPNCGSMVELDSSILSDIDKEMAVERSSGHYLYRRNCLKALLLNLDFMERKENSIVRIKNI